MTKALVFDGSQQAQDRLRFIHQGLCMSPRQQQPRDLETLRREGSLRRRIEKVSVPDPTVQPAGRFQWVPRVLVGPAEVLVEQADMQLLKDYMLALPWTPMVADVVVDTIEWVMGAPEVKDAAS